MSASGDRMKREAKEHLTALEGLTDRLRRGLRTGDYSPRSSVVGAATVSEALEIARAKPKRETVDELLKGILHEHAHIESALESLHEHEL